MNVGCVCWHVHVVSCCSWGNLLRSSKSIHWELFVVREHTSDLPRSCVHTSGPPRSYVQHIKHMQSLYG